MPLAIEPEEPRATQSAAPPTRTSQLCAHDSVCAPNSAQCPTGAACPCRMCAMTAVVAHMRAILPQCKSKLFHRRRRRHTWKPGTAGVPGGPGSGFPRASPRVGNREDLLPVKPAPPGHLSFWKCNIFDSPQLSARTPPDARPPLCTHPRRTDQSATPTAPTRLPRAQAKATSSLACSTARLRKDEAGRCSTAGADARGMRRC